MFKRATRFSRSTDTATDEAQMALSICPSARAAGAVCCVVVVFVSPPPKTNQQQEKLRLCLSALSISLPGQ